MCSLCSLFGGLNSCHLGVLYDIIYEGEGVVPRPCTVSERGMWFSRSRGKTTR